MPAKKAPNNQSDKIGSGLRKGSFNTLEKAITPNAREFKKSGTIQYNTGAQKKLQPSYAQAEFDRAYPPETSDAAPTDVLASFDPKTIDAAVQQLQQLDDTFDPTDPANAETIAQMAAQISGQPDPTAKDDLHTLVQQELARRDAAAGLQGAPSVARVNAPIQPAINPTQNAVLAKMLGGK